MINRKCTRLLMSAKSEHSIQNVSKLRMFRSVVALKNRTFFLFINQKKTTTTTTWHSSAPAVPTWRIKCWSLRLPPLRARPKSDMSGHGVKFDKENLQKAGL